MSMSRRHVLGGAAAVAALGAVHASAPAEAGAAAAPLELWYPAPARLDAMIEQGLPIGNGQIGALAGGDPARELLLVTDGAQWTGHRNEVLEGDGQFPYGRDDFGSFTLLARLGIALPTHTSVTGYRRALNLTDGVVTVSYVSNGVTYRREIYASHPDGVIVIRLTQSGGGSYTGSVSLAGTHGEAAIGTSFGAAFANKLKYGASVTVVRGRTGTVDGLTFAGCEELTVVLAAGTNYAPDLATGYRDAAADPVRQAETRAAAAARVPAATLRQRHVADYRRLFERMTVSLGTSDRTQQGLDTWQRLHARAADGARPDPELEALYLQYGRYLMICGSRDGLPLNLQGLWLDGNDPDWMGDYHTDVNIQMNYWQADRAGLAPCFDAFTDYLIAQVPSWTELTRKSFNDPRNRFRNTSGAVAGWTVAFSTNIHGGNGWLWHPGGNAWLCLSLWEHYEYTQDRRYLERIYPLLKGACEFWEARLVATMAVDRPGVTRGARKVLIDDHDWSPEHGPQDARGMTYAQELVWALFENYRTATGLLGRDARHRETIGGLQDMLYLPQVSPTSGWLEEWMSPDNLGETTHRHLSPLMGLFPGDRIRPGAVPDTILEGARKLLTARGLDSFGWANAWRAACWARLGDAETAYQLVVRNLRPSVAHSNGTAANLFDMYQVDTGRSIFQIDANFGTPAAMIEMLVYSRPGQITLLPALPSAWAGSGRITGVGIRGGFTLDLEWRQGKPVSARVTSIGGRSTAVTFGDDTRQVRLARGASVKLGGWR
jgi:alpha-L-fucosidase 2